MPATSKKLTVSEVKRRVDELYTYRKTVKGGFRWDNPEHCQGLIDRLREDVIQAIANGSKVPYALTRCIADLPRVDYGTIPTEPARTTVTKVAASTMYGKMPCVDCHESMELDENSRCCHCRIHHLPTENQVDEIALVERYQQCVSELLTMFSSDSLGNSPAHFYIERLEELVKQKLLRPNLPTTKVDDDSPTSSMTSEQYYAIREYLVPDPDEPSYKYPPDMSPRALREAFDNLVEMHKKRKTFMDRIAVAADTFLKECKTASG